MGLPFGADGMETPTGSFAVERPRMPVHGAVIVWMESWDVMPRAGRFQAVRIVFNKLKCE